MGAGARAVWAEAGGAEEVRTREGDSVMAGEDHEGKQEEGKVAATEASARDGDVRAGHMEAGEGTVTAVTEDENNIVTPRLYILELYLQFWTVHVLTYFQALCVDSTLSYVLICKLVKAVGLDILQHTRRHQPAQCRFIQCRPGFG